MKITKLVFFAVLMLLSISSFAQSFTPVDYAFMKVPTTSRYGISGTQSFPRYLLTSTSANGYGIWGVNKVNKWFLMSNLISDQVQSAGTIGSGPYGDVSSGTFDSSFNATVAGYVKVTANLRGSVRFVALSASRDSILIRGFDDEHLRDTLPDIDIRFLGIPKPLSTNDPIKASPRKFPSIFLGMGGVQAGPRVTQAHEADPLDWFDVACDAKYLYITWTRSLSADSVIFPTLQVWAAAVELSTGNVAVNPFRVTNPAVLQGVGRRPTIACDVRHNGSAPFGPRFDVSYITAINNVDGNPRRVMHFFYNNGANIGPYPMLDSMRFIAGGSNNMYGNPQHCRILVGSVPNWGGIAPVKGIYVLVDRHDTLGNLANHLVFHKILNNTDAINIGSMVDGILRNTLRPSPVQNGPTFVYDAPIAAVANPYDGRANSEYDEFHCLYSVYQFVGGEAKKPVLIVRGTNNGFFGATNTITPLSRFSLNGGTSWQRTLGHIDDEYVLSVNQMGLFASWRAADTGNYERVIFTRDTSRRFDEAIEENTLVSHRCFVGDGTTHLGTPGATLANGLKMTLWTDPYYRKDSANDATYIPGNHPNGENYNANLMFVNTSHSVPVSLQIGASNSTYSSPQSFLTCLPNHLITYHDSLTDRAQSLIINPYHQLDWYGGPFDSVPVNYRRSTIHGAGKIILKPNSDLFIHGGAKMIIHDYARLEANRAFITFLHEPSILPISNTTDSNYQNQTTGLNVNDHGKLIVYGSAKIDTSYVYAGVGHYERESLIQILPSLYEYSTPPLNVNQFSATQTFFDGGYLIPTPGIDFGLFNFGILADADVNKPVRKVLVNECFLFGTVIIGERITTDFTITNSQFWRYGGDAAISITRPITSTDSYENITISGNEIAIDDEHTLDFSLAIPAIHIQNYSLPRTTAIDGDEIIVSDNYIYPSGGLTPYYERGDSCYAIGLFNTSAIVTGNIVDMAGMKYGIQNIYQGAVNAFSNSFFCSNSITNCSGAGLSTRQWRGHGRKNRISGSAVGHNSISQDLAGITYSRYYNNIGPGLKLSHGTTSISLRGVSGSGGAAQYPAYDTIDHNNSPYSDTSGQIVTYSANLKMGTNDMDTADFENFAKNNIIADSLGHNLIYAPYPSTAIGGINQNYWGFGNWGSLTPILLPPHDNTLMPGIEYQPAIDSPVCSTTPFGDPETVSCGIWYIWQVVKPNEQRPQSLDSVSCIELQELAASYEFETKFRLEYDTLKYAMEQCYSINKYWNNFSGINFSCYGMSNIPERFDTCREWLKKVLYYNTIDSDYYCADVNAIKGTFWYFPGRGIDLLGALAIEKYIVESGKCTNWWTRADYINDSVYTMKELIYSWRDSVQDSIKTPFNPVMPTIDDLNLGILRGPNEVVGRTHDYRLGELIAVRNPFNDVLDLKYHLIKNGLVKVDVLDVLGRTIYSEGQGYKPEGEHTLTIQTHTWSSGSYYVRLSTPSGEIKTVKLIKE
jgi:hypothetical protein